MKAGGTEGRERREEEKEKGEEKREQGTGVTSGERVMTC